MVFEICGWLEILYRYFSSRVKSIKDLVINVCM